MNAWIQHVKAYAKKNGITYKEALKGASKTYKSGNDSDSDSDSEDRMKNSKSRKKAS